MNEDVTNNAARQNNRRRAGAPRRSLATILLLISIAGLLIANIFWSESSGLNKLLSSRLQSAVTVVVETDDDDDDDDDDYDKNGYPSTTSTSDELERLRRLAKYFQTYRYIPPAPRYEMLDPIPASKCGRAPNFQPWWELGKKERSRAREDQIIYNFFFKENSGYKGTYLELGAYNGRDESNSRFFDDCLGWKGLLIEGNPRIYPQTIENRPYAHKMSLAPSCSAEYEAANKTVQFFNHKWTNAGLVGHANAYSTNTSSTFDVPCGPLAPILQDVFANNDSESESSSNDTTARTNLPTLDFFSLDVEGSETLVLSTIDFEAVRINILLVEVKNNFCQDDNCEGRRQIRSIMQAAGYKRYEKLIKFSDLYVHPESPFQVPVVSSNNSSF